MAINFGRNAYVTALKANTVGLTDRVLFNTATELLQFKYGQLTYALYSPHHQHVNIRRRIVTAIPKALYSGIVKTAKHIFSAFGCYKKRNALPYLKLHVFLVIRDVQESVGNIISIFHKYGTYMVQDAQFQKTCYMCSPHMYSGTNLPRYMNGLNASARLVPNPDEVRREQVREERREAPREERREAAEPAPEPRPENRNPPPAARDNPVLPDPVREDQPEEVAGEPAPAPAPRPRGDTVASDEDFARRLEADLNAPAAKPAPGAAVEQDDLSDQGQNGAPNGVTDEELALLLQAQDFNDAVNANKPAAGAPVAPVPPVGKQKPAAAVVPNILNEAPRVAARTAEQYTRHVTDVIIPRYKEFANIESKENRRTNILSVIRDMLNLVNPEDGVDRNLPIEIIFADASIPQNLKNEFFIILAGLDINDKEQMGRCERSLQRIEGNDPEKDDLYAMYTNALINRKMLDYRATFFAASISDRKMKVTQLFNLLYAQYQEKEAQKNQAVINGEKIEDMHINDTLFELYILTFIPLISEYDLRDENHNIDFDNVVKPKLKAFIVENKAELNRYIENKKEKFFMNSVDALCRNFAVKLRNEKAAAVVVAPVPAQAKAS